MTDAPGSVWGRRPVQEALRRGIVQKVFLGERQQKHGILAEIIHTATSSGIPIARMSEQQLDDWADGGRTQGVFAYVDPPKTVDLADVLVATSSAGSPPFFLVLDQIQDPHNFGALLRTANAAGVDAVIVPEKRSAPLSGTVAKTSAGAIHHVNIVEVKNLRRALEDLQKHNIWIFGLDETSRQTVYDVDFRTPTALVVGNEGDGLRSLTQQACDCLVRLPMAGAVGSLNVSVAGAIAMYEVVRQRTSVAPDIG